MRPLWSNALRFRKVFRQLTAAALGLLLAAPAFAQGASPWENAVGVLQQAFTSTIARGLSLVAIVVSGLTFAFAPSRRTSLIRSTLSCNSNGDQAGALFLRWSKSIATIPNWTSTTSAPSIRHARSNHEPY